jgi:TM2 domain-containing membrane protein YozV
MLHNNPIMAKKPSQAIAIVALLLNILVLPGLGTIIGGRNKQGVIQLVLFVVSIILDITIIGLIVGIPLGIAMWIWGIVSGVQIVQEAQ